MTKLIPRWIRMKQVTESLPADECFGRAALEHAIRNSGKTQITSRQSIHEYVNEMVATGWIEWYGADYRVAPRALEAGTIRITVQPVLRAPTILDKVKRAIEGIEGVTIEEVI